MANEQIVGTLSVTGAAGFNGQAPVVAASLTAVTTTQPSVTAFGFTTTAQFNNLIANVNSIISALKTAGLMTSP
jgi:hypothetical protein